MDTRGSHLIPHSCLADGGPQLTLPTPSPRSTPGRHIWKTLLQPSEGRDPVVNVCWRIWLGKAPVISLSVFGNELFSAKICHPVRFQTLKGTLLGNFTHPGPLERDSGSDLFHPCTDLMGLRGSHVGTIIQLRLSSRGGETVMKVLISCYFYLAAISHKDHWRN